MPKSSHPEDRQPEGGQQSTSTSISAPEPDSRGRSDFKTLFLMNIHCAGTGLAVLLIIILTTLLNVLYRNITFNANFPALVLSLVAVFALFLTALFRAAKAANWPPDQLKEHGHKPLAWCCGLCVAAIVILIWLTGAVRSPICSVYVMTHSLTLLKVRPAFRKSLFYYYIIPIVGSFLLIYVAHPIDKGTMKDLQNDWTHDLMLGSGVLVPILISTLSMRWTAREATTD